MDWLRFTLRTEKAQADAVSEALTSCGAQAVTLQDAEDQPLFEPGPGETPLWQQIEVTGLFTAGIDTDKLLAQLAAQLGNDILRTQRLEPLEDKDWSRAWMDDYRPMQFGHRVWIVPSWTEPPDPDAVNILLDPGLAFGTGTHPTTALCLEWLDSQALAGKHVLDYGCGSGILAIAAARLGTASVTAIDIDPQALTATRNNAERNNVSALIQTGLPGALAEDQQFDIVIANILAGPLVELAPLLCSHLRAGGELALSGVLAEQADEVSQAYSRFCGMALPSVREDWVRLSGQRN